MVCCRLAAKKNRFPSVGISAKFAPRMLLLLPIWTVLFALVFGCGALCLRLMVRLGGTAFRHASVLQVGWLGTAFLLAVLELGSLVVPVGRGLLVALAVLAAVGIIGARRSIARCMRMARRRPLRVASIALAGMGVALAIAASATQTVIWFDTYLYHLQVVKWTTAYAAVPGLANLHSRLAFNSSFHLLAALTETPWAGQSAHLALPFLALMSGLHHLEFLVGRPGQGRAIGRACAAVSGAYLAAFVWSYQLASLSSDGALALLCTSAVLEMVAWRPRAAYRSGTGLAVMLALAASAFTTKLGGLTLLLVAACLLAYLRGARRWLVISTLPGLLLAGYFARQALLSGWLFFPIPIGDLHLSWSYPPADTMALFDLVRAWARLPNHAMSEVLAGGFWFWFRPWSVLFARSNEAVILLLAVVVLVLRARWPAPLAPGPGVKASLAASAASLAFWFTGAPDLRFGRIFFWLLLATAAAPLLARAAQGRMGRIAGAAFALLLLAWAGGLALKLPDARYMLAMPPLARFESKRVVLGSGLQVLVPVEAAHARCGDAELPCTPMPARQRLRRPGDLGSGFLAE